MSKIKCMIIEDEPLAVKILADYIRQTPFLELQGHLKTPSWQLISFGLIVQILFFWTFTSRN